MIKKRRGLNDSQNILNIDSLVDIVSNKVGILIILAVFIAIFSLKEKTTQVHKNEEPISNTEKIKIPWSHSSQKNSLLFLLRDNRLLFFDRAIIFKKLRKYLSSKKSLPKQINLENYFIELITGSRHSHCIEFFPKYSAGDWWHKVYRKDGLIQKLKKKFPPEENYFFFWVNSKSFTIFREIREYLWNENFEVGWKPIRNESTLQFCSGNHQNKYFNPQ